MRNVKKTTRALLFVLVAMLLASMLAVSSFADHDDVYGLTEGVVDFEDYDGTSSAHAYLYDKLGMYFTDLGAKDAQNMPKPSNKVSVKNIAADGEPDNYVMELTGMAYVDGSMSGTSVDQLKYAMNKDILDLLFSKTGPDNYTMQFDMIINSELPATTADSSKYPTSAYRGISVISIGQFNYFFKATNAGVGKYEDTGETVTLGDNEYPVYKATASADPDKGWLYASGTETDVVATADNGIAIEGSCANWNGENVLITGAIAPATMEEGGGAVQYTKGKPFTVIMKFTRNTANGGATVDVYLDMQDGNGAKLFVSQKAISGTDTHKANGIRFMDTTNSFEVLFDNFSIAIDKACQLHHGGFGSAQRLVRVGNAYYIQSYCEICDRAYSEKTLVHSEKIPYTSNMTADSSGVYKFPLKFTSQLNLTVDKSYIVKTASPYRISFDLKVNAITPDAVTTTDGETISAGVTANGTTLLGFNTGSYPNMLRLWPAYDENGNMLNDRYIVRTSSGSNNSNRYVGTIKVNESYSFDVVVTDPSKGTFDVYMNGKYKATYTDGDIAFADSISKGEIRFLANPDRNIGAFEISNLLLTKESANSHECEEDNRTVILKDDGLYIFDNDKCLLCGENVYSKTTGSLYDTSLNGSSINASLVLDEKGSVTIQSATWLYSTEAVLGSNGSPFWLAFDINVNSLKPTPINLTTSSNLLNFSGNNKGPLRVYGVKTNGVDIATDSSDLSKDKVAIKSDRDGNGEILFYLEKGDTRSVALYCDPADKSVEIYVDGEYILTRTGALGSAESGKWFMRFMDNDWANLTLSNFTFASATETFEHTTHTDEFSTDIASTVKNDTVTTSYTCFCGEKVTETENIVELVKNNLVDSYEGVTAIAEMPTTGEYWVLFDYNARSAGNIVADALALGDTVICVVNDEFAKPTSKVYAVRIEYVGEGVVNYDVYVDGALCASDENVTIGGDASVLTLGDENATDVRFNSLKVVKFGTGEAVAPDFTANELKPCYHGAPASADSITVLGTPIVYSYLCPDCGERVFVSPTKNLYDASLNQRSDNLKVENGSATVTTTTTLYAPKSVLGAEGEDFWLSFNLKVDDLAIDKMSGYADKRTGGGYNLLNFTDTFDSPLRMYLVDKNGELAVTKDYIDTSKVAIKDNAKRNGENIAILEKGESYVIALYCHPETGSVDIYIDGEYVSTRTDALDADGIGGKKQEYYIRFLDGAWGVFTLEDIVFASVTDTHVHTDKWSDGFKVSADKETLTCSCVCYCGETISKQINGIVLDNIASVYGKGTQRYNAPDGEYWIASNIVTDENTAGALITLGDSLLLDAEEIADVKNATVAICVNGNAYTLYVDGEQLSSGEWLGESVITFGNDSLINADEGYVSTAFIYNKIVTVGFTDTPAVPKVNGCDHFNENDDILCDLCEMNIVREYPNVINNFIDKFTSQYNVPEEGKGYVFAPVTSAQMGEMLSMDSFWISFDFTANEVPADLGSTGKSFLTWVSTKTSGAYNVYYQLLRAFNAVDGDGNKITNALELRVRDTAGKYYPFDKSVIFNVGEKYSIDIRIEPLNNGYCNYFVYVNGELCGQQVTQFDAAKTEHKTMNANIPFYLRFNDKETGKYTYENAKAYADHAHETSDSRVSYDVFDGSFVPSLVSTCSVCGNEVVESFSKAVGTEISAIYNGYDEISVTAPDKKWIVTTDVNIRDENVSGSLLSIDDTIVLSVPASLDLPTTISVAVIIDGNGFETYVNGEFFQRGELNAPVTKVVFGNENQGAFVRYTNNKMAVLDTVYTPIQIASPADEDVKACYHVMSTNVANSIYYGADGSLHSVYNCAKCGERIYAEFNENMITHFSGEAWDNKNGNEKSLFVHTSDYNFSKTASPYWISFDITPVRLPTPDPNEKMDRVEDKRIYKGYSLAVVQPYSGIYSSQLRIIADGWEPGDGCDFNTLTQGVTDGEAGVYLHGGAYRTTRVASLKVGVKVNFALYIDPTTGNYDVYVNGDYVGSSKTDAYAVNNAPAIRFGEYDDGKCGKWRYENFKVVRETVNYNDDIIVIETDAKFTPTAADADSAAYEALVSIDRTDAEGAVKKLDLLYVDSFTGELAYKANETDYIALLNSAGNPLVLTDKAIELAVVYNDVKGTARYFINGILPYVENTDAAEGEPSVKLLGDIPVYDSTFAQTDSVADKISGRIVIVGKDNRDMSIDVEIKDIYCLNESGTAEVLGYQENDITGDIRFVAGIDTNYYTEIGFDLKIFDADGNDVTSAEKPDMLGNVIYSAVTANERYLYAGRYGYDYFAVINIEEITNRSQYVGYTIEVTPYTRVGSYEKVYGATATVIITADGYEYTELGNGFTPLPSAPTYEQGLDKLVGLRRVELISKEASADTYITGEYPNENFGSDELLDFKAINGSQTGLHRIVLLRFDISDVDVDNIVSAKLSLNCTWVQDTAVTTLVNVYRCKKIYSNSFFEKLDILGEEWDEDTVTYKKKPSRGELLASAYVYGTGVTLIDITDYVKKAKNEGLNEISLYLDGDTETVFRLKFSSTDSEAGGPMLVFSDSVAEFSTDINYDGVNPWDYAAENVSEWLDRWEVVKLGGDTDVQTIQKIDSEYALTVGATTEPDGENTKYKDRPTRTVDTLVGFTSTVDDKAMLDIYGGYMDESLKQEATGFFYTTKIGDRWWTIDPLGYPFYRVACVAIGTGSTRQTAAMLSKYNGSISEWAKGTTDRLRELGYNSVGGWSKIENLSTVNQPLTQTSILYVASKYCSKNGLNVSNSGSTELLYDVIPVFDPAFIDFADKTVRDGVALYANSSSIYGWMSDNELPSSKGMLDSALTLDVEDERFAYTYATAWTFLYLKTGKTNPTLADVTDELRREYRAMVYDRYFKIVANALEKYAPNHQYLGSRFVGGCYNDEYVMRVAGYWCDVVSLNYYGVWEGKAELLANMQKWAGKPFIITEWYAKGMDACTPENGLTNESGAGWTVATQNDRGLFYENYALQLLECKGCVGFDWFQFLDNDTQNTAADLSNTNANKGIYDSDANEYTELTVHMDKLNNQKYSLIDFFDIRNSND